MCFRAVPGRPGCVLLAGFSSGMSDKCKKAGCFPAQPMVMTNRPLDRLLVCRLLSMPALFLARIPLTWRTCKRTATPIRTSTRMGMGQRKNVVVIGVASRFVWGEPY